MRISIVLVLVLAVAADARAECNCVAIAGDVSAAIQAEVAKADSLYARADFDAALSIYARAYASSKDSVLLYAQAMAEWQRGQRDRAKELFEAYLHAGGTLVYKDRAEAGLRGIGAGVTAAAVGAAGATLGGVGAVTGGVTGELRAQADVKPKKIGKTAGIVLGVIAVAAIGAVGVQMIAAGVSSDISLDPGFDIGLGVAGVSVGISAIYVAGLTAAAPAVPAVQCATLPAKKPVIAPIVLRGGGGLGAALSF